MLPSRTLDRAGRRNRRPGPDRPGHAGPVHRLDPGPDGRQRAGRAVDNNGGAVGPIRTPAPSNVVIVDPPQRTSRARLVYVKQGNLWTQTGNKAVQITTSGRGSMPSWSPDGQWIYYIESVHDQGFFPGGSDGPEPLLDGLSGPDQSLTRTEPDRRSCSAAASRRARTPGSSGFASRGWHPTVGPWRSRSDGPDPTKSDVVLQVYDVKTDKTRRLNLPENPPLGHQDPAWRPDGKLLLYVKNGRDGTRGAPTIYRYDPATKRNVALSAPGYMQPSWSPDGRWVAVTKTSTLGTDVAILDARNGSEVLRLTNDGRSWAPVWSPKGDTIAYMHIDGLIVDLKMIGLTGTAPGWTAEPAARRHPVQRARRRIGRELVHPARPAPGTGRRTLRRRQPERLVRLRDRRLPRAAGGPDRRDGNGPVPGSRPGSGQPAGRLRARRRRHRGVQPAPARGIPGVGDGGQGEPRLLRGVRAGRASPRSSGSGESIPADVPFIADAKRGDIGSTAARQAVALFDRLGADAITANPYLGVGGDRAPPRADRSVRLRPVPDVEPGRRRAPGRAPCRDGRRRAGRAALRRGSPAWPAGWGPGGTVGLVVGATAPAELARVRAIAPGLALPRPGRRGPGRRDRAGPRVTARRPQLPAGRPVRRRAARQRLAGDRRGRRRDGRPGPPGDPRERPSRRPPATGPSASLCYCRRRRIWASSDRQGAAPHRCRLPDRSNSSSSS